MITSVVESWTAQPLGLYPQTLQVATYSQCSLFGRILFLCRGAASTFYSSSQQNDHKECLSKKNQSIRLKHWGVDCCQNKPLYCMKWIKDFTYMRISKLATVVESNQKASFSITTTPRCKGGYYSFPWISPLYPWYVPYIAEC